MLIVCGARERRSFTYGEIAETLKIGGAAVMAKFLGPIMRYYKAKGLPLITVLVVNKITGLSGEGLTTLEEVNFDRDQVFNYDWFFILSHLKQKVLRPMAKKKANEALSQPPEISWWPHRRVSTRSVRAVVGSY